MRCVLYVRVSTNEIRQDVNNQIEPLKNYAKSLDFNIVGEYIDYASGGDSNRPKFQAMLNGARKKEFDMILIWALDRFSREGILNTLSYLNVLKQHNVALKSLQESWLDTRDEGMGQLLIAIFSWVAQQERHRISERIKAGLKRAKNVGKRGKDKKRRRISGYIQRWGKKTPP